MGTGHLFTRREVYNLVWAGPISALAKTLQVSDVWLAKTCRLSNVPPPPPRGAHLLNQVRCAAINGDLATKLAAYRARIDNVPGDVSHFLEFLQRAVEAQTPTFYSLFDDGTKLEHYAALSRLRTRSATIILSGS